MTTSEAKTVFITGCSDNSLGSALAHQFHAEGLTVFASARDPSKAQSLKDAGIRVIELDVLSDDSIKSTVEQVSRLTDGKLNILVNNAGGGHYMPFLHLDLQKARELFDVNVWSYLAVTQAFLPLLLKDASPSAKSGRTAMIVNNTSISSVLKTPFHSAYSASKAAIAAFNDAQRIELGPLGVTVVDLKTGSLESNFGPNRTNELELPADSPYLAIKDEVMNVITGNATEAYAEDQESWAKNVVDDLIKDNPPAQIWRGGAAGLVKVSNAFNEIIPTSTSDTQFQKLGGLDKLEKLNREKPGSS